ncbi:MAG TPA: TlyA family RNA methyltransferase [Chthoniobacterales bacterium]|jgi:23S rRNA (cytidine1920-2'-O)/16S rRNA (cytidine1409-2'-O)-methyltransferase|nr:TlyA family RNA methyltransferase [Chthoniobacterales bacterium]
MPRRNDPAKLKKARLDTALVDRGFFSSREQAQRAIMAGEVRVGEAVIDKASANIAPDAAITVESSPAYVGRGGLKLEGALRDFSIEVAGIIALDIGASTGGFTDCLLQHSAKKVYAIDVGHGQLAWKIRNDPRVVVREKLNARYLSPADIPELAQLCVIDVSFISLTLILPKAFESVTANGMILALIKPQFELEASDVGRGGIVREPVLHAKAQEKIRHFVVDAGHEVIGIVPSAITGTDGNQEFFICVRKQSA